MAVILAGPTKREKYDVVRNSALRIIAGVAKSIPITERVPSSLSIVVETNSISNFGGETVERVWMCNTETQTSPLSHARFLMKKYKLPHLMTLRAPMQYNSAVVPFFPSKRLKPFLMC
ncbi:hypothetical protein TNCV_77261 [Trichonephila clavipes]|nr:hypothetical protein TNCV_77261 [Trichonephila clavipes]